MSRPQPNVKPSGDLSLIAVAVSAGKGFSPLFRWMRAHHDEFAELVEGARPNWARIAEAFAQMGIAGPDGEPLLAETVRHTWWRAKRDIVLRRTRREAARQPPVREAVINAPPQPAAAAGDPLAEIRRQIDERSGRKQNAP